MDTIGALASPAGRGAVAVLRISGPEARSVAQRLVGRTLRPRFAHFVTLTDPDSEETIDQGLAIYFPAPASFTGEDIVELQIHSSPASIDMALSAIASQGVRMARPGEFSERAYLNGKLDLNQAEAIADLIAASSADAARSALRTLKGEFSRQIHQLLHALIEARVALEARLDFPDEELPAVDVADIERLRQLLASTEALMAAAATGALLADGINIVLVGPPNAGKSSVFNRLLGEDHAIVTDVPGTTRDVIRAEVVIEGITMRIHDTAGFQETSDIVEQEGIRRGLDLLEAADLVIHVIAPDIPDSIEALTQTERLALAGRLITILNKRDLLQSAGDPLAHRADYLISAKTGDGFEAFRAALASLAAGHRQPAKEAFSARPRHIAALRQLQQSLGNAYQSTTAGTSELAAEYLRESQRHLSLITGSFDTDDLLGEIFSRFCIGK